MKIRIIGAGAVGCLLGSLLAEAGHEVTFSGSPESMGQLRAQGLRVVLPDRWLRLERVRTADDGQWRGKADWLLVALKRHQLKELKARSRAFFSGPSGSPAASRFLFLNCDPQDALSLCPPRAEAYAGLSLLSSVLLQSGQVELCSRRSFLILPKSAELRELSAAWTEAGLEPLEVEEIDPYAHSFFIWQLLFLPVAMCHSTYEHFLSYPEGRQIALGVVEEALQTFSRQGRKLKALPAMDPQELAQKVHKRPREFEAARIEPDRAYNSLLQSLLRGKKTEVKELNERLVRMATEAGVKPEWNWGLVQKLSRVIQVGFYRTPAELCRALD